MIIAFHEVNLTYRGTSIALYDYAHYNELLLKNRSIIVYKTCSNDLIRKKFTDRFHCFNYTDIEMLDKYLIEQNCTHMYTINQGYKTDLPKSVKNLIHCVYDMSDPHGHKYAGVSKSLANKFSSSCYVPHMISIKPDLRYNWRKILNIPEQATVFGRYGGVDTFNVSFCISAIKTIVANNDNIYFLLNAVAPFIEHNQVIFYNEMLVSDRDKSAFITTCDAYLECCSLGHSFGLSLGEFSVHNRPALIYNKPNSSFWNDAHLQIVGQKGLLFSSEQEFTDLILNFDRSYYQQKDNNCYKDYSPEKVIDIFQTIFLNNK